jgi:hypothetical protein
MSLFHFWEAKAKKAKAQQLAKIKHRASIFHLNKISLYLKAI